ncbi:MAG: rhombotarget lipoprotein, partial [Gammaproteobacteria bacterium]|nr:rhombotarget lipoprotein [Gammaproteobacteria bacterium]
MKVLIKTAVTGLITAAALSGCASLWQDVASAGGARQGVSSSLVDYLYPGGEQPPKVDGVIPNLQVPLRVGLAFVPSNSSTTPGLSEASKTVLLERVRDAFREREFIAHIEVIPETYLRSRRGFESLEQVGRLYQLDVMALVSYDQVVHSDDRASSILYWTVIGAYVVKGSKNDVQTFVDTAIFDIPTRRLLFRAPGVDKSSSNTTLIGSADELRRNREQGFERAMADMTTNLAVELDAFRERIKQDKSVVVTERPGYRGGGAGA